MNIVIVEDERMTSEELALSIMEFAPANTQIMQLRSVKDAIAHFKSNPNPDLIFCDIKLGDGLSFEIFTTVQITAPVIFCTAYNEYAVRAFKANGIDYILKPFTSEMLEEAFHKFISLKDNFNSAITEKYKRILEMIGSAESRQAGAILVYYQDRIMPLKLQEIAIMYIENETTHVLTIKGKIYHPNKKLEDLEKVAGEQFFRVNRQMLVNRSIVVDVSSFFSRKLSVNLSIPFDTKIVVSRDRTPLFLEWLTKSF